MTAAPHTPLCQSFKPAKQGAHRHYGVHPYFTKRAWNVVQEYIQHFTEPGATVLDPFGGSGITAVESLVLRRKAIYADINPWACFLARLTALAPVDLAELSKAFAQVESECRSHLEALSKTPNEMLEHEPLTDWYPKGVRLPSNADVTFVEELFTPRMLHSIARLRAAIVSVKDTVAQELLLFAFSATLARINRTFLSATDRSETRGGSAIFSLFRYKVAKSVVELPIWPQFEQRFRKLLQAKRETNNMIGDYYKENVTAVFRHASATRLSEWVKPESVDYIYTDPPYGGHIAYLDLSTMWTAWLQMDVNPRDKREEIIEGGEEKKTAEDYSTLMKTALMQMHETLKNGCWLSMVFAHRDTSYWESLIDACQQAGFQYYNTVVQPVGVVWSMHKKKNPLRVLSGELVLNFRKSAKPSKLVISQRFGNKDATEVVREQCERQIVNNIGATTEDLHHAVIPKLLETGLLASFSKTNNDIVKILQDFFTFDRQAGKWFLRDGNSHPFTGEKEVLLRYYVARFLSLHANRHVTVAQVQQYLRETLNTKISLTKKIIEDTLREFAESSDRIHWHLVAANGQGELNFGK